MPVVSLVHVSAAVIAMLAGLGVLLLTKGTRRHRRIGLAYLAAMLALNGTSLFIFSLNGAFSPFHAMALFSLATVLAGFAAVFLRRPRGYWLELHMQFMVWSYIGLAAAAASEAAVRIPESPFWWAVGVASALVLAAGGIAFARQLPGIRRRYGWIANRGLP